jgi:hypothetical protein
MRYLKNPWFAGWFLVVFLGTLAVSGCIHTPVDVSDKAQGPAPLRMPSPAKEEECHCYEDSLTGGQIFSMYCSYCHNAPALGERNFANFKNVATHMRVRANLTGKEYAKLMEFLRRWHDVGPNHPPIETTPKRFIFSQPIPETKDEKPKEEPAPVPRPVEPKGKAILEAPEVLPGLAPKQ